MHTISSPGRRSRPIARVIENTLLVVDGPKTNPAGSAPSNSPIVAWVRSSERVARLGGGKCAVAVGVVAAALPVGGCVDRGVDDLGARRSVEARPAVRQTREAVPHVDGDCRVHLAGLGVDAVAWDIVASDMASNLLVPAGLRPMSQTGRSVTGLTEMMDG